MESKITTYLFYTGLIFSLITMLFCTLVFHKNIKEQNHNVLKGCCEAITENLKTAEPDNVSAALPESVYFAVLKMDKSFIYGNETEYINSDTLLSDDDIKNFSKNGFSEGIIKTKSINSDIYYYAVTIPENRCLYVYTEMNTVYDTAGKALPYLIGIFFCVILFSALSAIFLTDRFMKPIYYISSDNFDAENQSADSNIYKELLPILKVKSKAEKMKRQFTANVSHELKTPLTSIIGYAQLIESKIATGDDIIKFASVINKESQRMLYLVGDILKLSELEEENSNLVTEPTDLYELSKNAIEALEVVAKKNDVTMTLMGESTIINANKNLIYELIYNLCDNAIRYNKPGGSVTVNTKYNAVAVSDTGIGIDKKYHSRIFERFYRVDKSRSKQTGGTGLGLSIVKHIAELHHGKISIISEPGVGTQITVTF